MIHMRKVLQKAASWRICRNSNYRFRRLLANPSSLSRRLSGSRSVNGVKPFPTTPDDHVDASQSMSADDTDWKTKLQLFVEEIDGMIMSNCNPDDKNRLTEIRACLESNIPQIGTILDKLGGAANGQVPQQVYVPGTPAQSSSSFSNVAASAQECSKILKGLGRLHAVGAVLIILAVIMERFSKVGKNDKKLLNYLKKLRDLAKHVLQICDVLPTSEADETLQKAFLLICDHYVFCFHRVKTKKCLVTRLWYAEYDNETLVDKQKEIDALYLKLLFAAWLSDKVHSRRVAEDIEPSEDIVSVGNEKRVEEPLQKLKNSYSLQGVRALVLFGMHGVGKSAVGAQIVAELITSKQFDIPHYYKLSMGSEQKAISVTKLQQKLLRKLSGTSILPNVSDPADGRQKLCILFRTRFLTKPVVLYFDNVQNVQDLELLLPEKLDTLLHPGSILLATTTNQGVISLLKRRSPGVITLSYEVRELEEQQAQALLLRKIFGDKDVVTSSGMVRDLMNYKEEGVTMMWKLLKLCGGLPLALICVGSHIWGKGHSFLRSHIDELKLHTLSFEEAHGELNEETRRLFMKKLQEAVRHACNSLSYGDRVSKDALYRTLEFACDQLRLDRRIQEVFLDIVHVHMGSLWADVERICGADELETLKQLSMVNRLVYKDGTSSPILHVHDMLVGVGRRMANLDFEGRWVLLENKEEVLKYFNNDLPERFRRKELHRPRAFVAKLDGCKEELSAEQLDLVMTRDLQFLELQDTTITGSCSNFPANLKYFKCRRSSLPFPLQNLHSPVVLDLDLKMHTTRNLESIESMPHLQKLMLKNSLSLRKIGQGLEKLTVLAIHNCPNFKHLNPDARVLQQLEIVDCSRFSDFPRVSELIMKGVERLSLVGFAFTKFPETLVIPASVQIVDLSRNKNVEALPKFAPQNKIRILNLGSCSSLQEVPDIHSTNLEYLVLGGCALLGRITLSDEYLTKLKHLDVQGCPMEELKLSIEQIVDRTAAGFRLLGWEMEDTDDTPVGSCALFKRCLNTAQLSFQQTLSFFVKKPARSFHPPTRVFKTCCTFPLSSHSKHN